MLIFWKILNAMAEIKLVIEVATGMIFLKTVFIYIFSLNSLYSLYIAIYNLKERFEVNCLNKIQEMGSYS